MDYKHIGWKKCDFCGMETYGTEFMEWKPHGTELHGMELMEWNFME